MRWAAYNSVINRVNKETIGLMNRAAVMIGVRVFSTILTLVYTILITRTTTTVGTGQVMFAMSIAMIASVVFSLNVESGSIRYLTRYRAVDELAKAKGLIVFGRRLIVGSTLLTAIVGLAYVSAFGIPEKGGSGWVFLLAFAMCPFLALTRMVGRQGCALDGVLQSTLPRMLVRPLVFTFVLGIAWLSGYHLGPVVIMGLFFFSVISETVIQLFLLKPFFNFTKSVKTDFSEWKSWTGTGLLLSPSLVLQEYMKNIVIAVSAITIAPAQVAYFAVAFSVTNFLNFSISAIDISFGPRFAKCVPLGDKEKLARLTADSTVLKNLGVVTGCVLLIYFGEDIMALFGSEYTAATPLLAAFMLLPITNAILGPSVILLNIFGHSSSIFRSTLFGLAAIAFLTPLGGILNGALGAAFGTAVGYFILQYSLFTECRKKTGVDASLLGVIASRRAKKS